MPTSPPSAEPPVSPPSVRVATGLMAALAVLLLLNAALTWIGRDGVVAALVDAGGIAAADAERTVVGWLVLYLVIGLTLLAGAVFLPGGRRWAHWAGLAGSTALAVLTLVSAFAVGGSTPVSLLLLVLCLAAITSLAARPTRVWVARSRAPVGPAAGQP